MDLKQFLFELKLQLTSLFDGFQEYLFVIDKERVWSEFRLMQLIQEEKPLL